MGRAALEVGNLTRQVVRILEEQRIKKGATRATLEDAASISHNRLGVILRCERPITIEETSSLCSALNLRLSEVIVDAEQAITGEPSSDTIATTSVDIPDSDLLPSNVEEEEAHEDTPAPPTSSEWDLAARHKKRRIEYEAIHQWDDVGEESQVPPDWDE